MIKRHIDKFLEGAHCHFIPSERNGHVPHVLKHHVLFGYSAILVLVKALILSGYVLLPAAVVYSSAVTADNIVALTNAARSAIGRIELSADDRLANAASGKALDMAAKEYFAHVGPDGKTPWDWIRGAGYAYRYAGENLAINYFTSEGALEGWMASPDHRKNIADERYTEIGVGVAKGTYQGFDTFYVVQMFGRPPDEPVVVADTGASSPAPTAEPTVAPAEPPVSLPAAPTSAVVEGATDAPIEPKAAPVVAAVVKPVDLTPAAYEVSIKAPEAKEVSLQLGRSSTELSQDTTTGLWTGAIAAAPDAVDQEQELVARVETEAGATIEPLAVVAPASTTQQVFVEAGTYQPLKLFGFIRISNLADAAFRFYVAIAILLSALLLITVLVKFEIQNHGVNAHVTFVIMLALAMAFI
jgi:hypothetical protein